MSNPPESEIKIFAALDYLRDNAVPYAQARANRTYLEEYRKTQKALLMQAAEMNGVNAISAQERDAYAAPEYVSHLVALKDAVEAEETLRWLFVAAQARIEAWRSLESSRRIEAKTL